MVTAFLTASRAGDRETGQALSGDCWPKVAGWFGNKHDRIDEFTVPDRPVPEPAPNAVKSRVRFRYTIESGESTGGGWVAELERDRPQARWRVCSLHPLTG